MGMDVFVALAYRWGNINEYGFLVGVFDTEKAALAAADQTYGERGGKYECEVLLVPMNHVFDGFDVAKEVLSLEPPRPVHREPDPLRDRKSIVEVRVITHVPNPPTARVALIFSDGATSAYLKEFPTHEAADQFAAGMREAISWHTNLSRS